MNDINDPNIKEILTRNSFMRRWYILRMMQINDSKYKKTLVEKAELNENKQNRNKIMKIGDRVKNDQRTT